MTARVATEASDSESTVCERPAMAVGWVVALLLAVGAVSLEGPPAAAQPLPLDQVPEPLRPWVPWVLDDAPTHGCTFVGGDRRCTWPGALALEIDADGGRFELEVVADREATIPLPGGPEQFPQEVRVDGSPAAVLEATERGDAGPAVRVAAGSHRIEGRLAWATMPDLLPVPPSIARVSLVLRGERVQAPRRETSGAVWLARPDTGQSGEGHFEMEVFRRLEDGVPFRVTTHLAIRASGEPREIELGTVLLPGMIPTAVDSDLAVRLRPDGTLTAQVHAGSFDIEVRSLRAAPPERLASPALASDEGLWPPREIWVWAADESLRQVELEGAPAVDPARTNLPEAWRSHPAYVLAPETALTFVTTRRGEPNPPPNAIRLDRELWLDLDGEGYTVRDSLQGRMTEGYRLSLEKGDLGHVVVDGRDQLVTQHGGADGVEIRSRDLDVRAEWRLPDATAELPAVAWSTDVQSLSATLHLPPGHTLLAASGVDDAPGTWVERWDLWGLFFVLLVSLALGRVFGWPWGVAAVVLLALSYHEEGAPLWSWAVLVAVAGLRLVWTKGRFGPRVLRWVYAAAFVVLAVISVMFATDQVRFALFPQTEVRGAAGFPGARSLTFHDEAVMAGEAVQAPAPQEQMAEDRAADASEPLGRVRERLESRDGARGSTESYGTKVQGWVDPNEVIQTGPGVPSWSFRAWQLGWSGPVARSHDVHLYVLTPTVTRLLALLRVLLLGALLIGIARFRFPRRTKPKPEAPSSGAAATPGTAGAAILLFAALAGASLLGPAHARAQALPDEDRLEELKERLTRAPECVPDCVVASSLRVRVDEARVTLEASVHAAAQSAYRIPGPSDAWVPDEVTVDGAPALGMSRFEDGFLFLRLEPGVHRVRMAGPIPNRDALTLAFGEPPRALEVDAEGWEVEGLRADGRVSESIQLRRTIQATEAEGRERQPLASWLLVRRRLDIGVRWTLTTTVERVTPTGQAVVVRIPLLEGESVTDSGILTEEGEVVVTLGRDDTRRSWTSVIEPREDLVLEAPTDVQWSERWTLACSPIWRCDTSGLAPVSHHEEGRWEPTFEPWPGESLTLTFARPEAAEGQSVTVDRAELVWEPGVRVLDATLEADIRTSSGGAQELTLPEGARVQTLEVDGEARPVQLEGRSLRVTLKPGSQTVRVEWQQQTALDAVFDPPAVGLGAAAVNARVRVDLPRDRWLLWTGGPGWGSAVLFWPYLVLVLVLAVALSRMRKSPLRVWDWALLGLGLTQIPAVAALIVVGWFFAMEHRRQTPELVPAWRFDLRQLGLAFFTLVALGCLYAAVHTGLLMQPDMEVFTPGGGGADRLDWYQDRIEGTMPSVWVLSLPMWIWRLVMLAWALWLALRVIAWARWSWRCFSEGTLWKRLTGGGPRRGPHGRGGPGGPGGMGTQAGAGVAVASSTEAPSSAGESGRVSAPTEADPAGASETPPHGTASPPPGAEPSSRGGETPYRSGAGAFGQSSSPPPPGDHPNRGDDPNRGGGD